MATKSPAKKPAAKRPVKPKISSFRENGPLVDGNYIRGICNALGLNPIENLCKLAMYSEDEKIKLQATSKLADYLVVLCNQEERKQMPYMIAKNREAADKLSDKLVIDVDRDGS